MFTTYGSRILFLKFDLLSKLDGSGLVEREWVGWTEGTECRLTGSRWAERRRMGTVGTGVVCRLAYSILKRTVEYNNFNKAETFT